MTKFEVRMRPESFVLRPSQFDIVMRPRTHYRWQPVLTLSRLR
jgi:hypothetical protein